MSKKIPSPIHLSTATSLAKKSFLAILAFLLCTQTHAQKFNIILGRPTQASITISILFDAPADFYIQYGPNETSLNLKSDTFHFNSSFPTEVELQNLLPSQSYFYQVFYKPTSSITFNKSETYHFHTQRNPNENFSFTVEADEHLYDIKGVKNLYDICLKNQASANPDFMLTLGDIFGDDHYPFTITEKEIDDLHKNYRPILGNITHSIPFYVCLGNHEGEMDYYLNYKPGDNLAYYATKYRKLYYPNPSPNSFYSGNTDFENWGIGYPENYYAWKWGNALFVVMDVYRDQCDTSAKPGAWTWTLGLPQYTWLKNTLESDTSKFKFVFAHHISGQGRGGINQAKLFEWGGHDGKTLNYTFPNKRPGWSKPIHQLFKDNGVNIFFQGHDHVFAREVLDNVIYQALPMPSDSTYHLGMLANADAYTADTLPGSGHLKVDVTANCVTISYISAYLPKDTLAANQKNNHVVFQYTIGDCSLNTESITAESLQPAIKIAPNPTSSYFNIIPTSSRAILSSNQVYEIYSITGKFIDNFTGNFYETSALSPGIYYLKTQINNSPIQLKFLKTH